MQRARRNRKKVAYGIFLKSMLVIAIVVQLFGFTGNQSAQAESMWSNLGTGLSSSYVRSIAVSGTDVYAGGNFTTAGGNPATHIAKWNGSQWSNLGTGLNSFVFAVAASGSDVYAGGIFSTAGGNSASTIAKWNGSNWSSLGTGTNGTVYAIAVSGTDVYVAGNFSTAGGIPATNIAKWNGTSWSSLGTGILNTVYALAVSGTDVYAAGSFSTAGGTSAVRIAKWNGTSWSNLGTGLNGDAYALAVSGSNVYVGGNFSTAGGSSANRIAKWDGSSWSSLGAGFDNTVSAITVSGSTVYAGGGFATAGGGSANRIAKWDGNSWSSLGAGLNNPVNAITVLGSTIYAGGAFTTAGGNSANLIAKWGDAATITFNSNGGSPVSSQSVAYGDIATVPTLPPTKAGYTFAGWYSDSGLNTAYDFATPVTVDLTLHAKWTIITATPVITGTVRAGDTSVLGTAAAEASIILSVNGTPATPTTATGGNWIVPGLTLASGDTISVTAQSAGESVSAAAMTTVAPAATNITTFDAIGDVAAGMAGSAAYANAGEVSAALLASHATVTADGATFTVPVTAWVDTDSYNPAVAGSYTFTATLGNLPANTTNTDNLTATVEVVVTPLIINITAFDAIGDILAGTAGAAAYANTGEVSAALLTSHTTVTADGGTIAVPVTAWVDTDSYNPAVAGSYTFTATLGSLPANTTNTSGLTATVEVIVSPVITNITAFDSIGDVAAGTAGSASYANSGEVSDALVASHATVTADGGTIAVPVTAWVDTDSYNPAVAGSYTFTATLGSLPVNTTNTNSLTATVEVVVSPVITNITAFDAIGDILAGTAGSTAYANAGEVTTALLASHATVTADGGTIAVPVAAWMDMDSYNPAVAGSYTFTAMLGSLPINTTNTDNLKATVEVVVAPVITNITAFDAIDDVAAGTAGAATYANAGEVTTGLLASHATVTADGGTITVPVTAWEDTDSYNASVAGSYTFTATLGSLPVNTTNTGNLTATVEVVVAPVITNITAFDAIGDISAGTAGSAAYANTGEVSAALLTSHATVTADGGTITVSVMAWEDTDSYNPAVAGSYTFTAKLGSLPANTTNTSGLTATVEVIVSPAITNITAFDAIGDVVAGTAGAATYANAGEVTAALVASHATVTADGGTIAVPVAAWIDMDNYNPAVAGSYTFTATLGNLPVNTTNTGNLTATVEVVVAPVITNITAFDAIGDVAAGTAGAAAYANAGEVSAALLTSHATVMADGGTITVPVTAWLDTDSYIATVAGSYTFTATLGSLPVNTTNTENLTATVEVVVAPVITNITAFDAIGDVAAGTAGAAAYANAGEVSVALLASYATVTADGGTIAVPVTAWIDSDNYNASVAGSYTFTATLGSLPINTTNTNSVTATVEVVVSPVITNITAFDAIGDVSAGTTGAATYVNASEVTAALLTSHAAVTADGGTITVPVTAWLDTDSYNATVAGSYTFTATLGNLPVNTTNTGNLTATVEVVVSPVITNITAFDAIGDILAGTAGVAAYANAGEVTTALLASHVTVTADGGTIAVPVAAWIDMDSYNPAVAGSYTFTATLGSLPDNTTNTSGLTATVEVIVSPVITNITAFDAIGDISAGTAGAAAYVNAGEVTTALLASHSTVTADGGAITVPVTAWVDTDSYNATVAGSYTFTATLGSLPVNTTNKGNLTATVEVVVAPVITNITAFDAIGDISAGTAGAAAYANASAVSASLSTSHATVTADSGTITVPVTAWVDTDSYNASVAGSYTFTATLGSLPVNTTNTGNLTATVEVIVAPVITNITAFDAIGDVAAGTAGSATYANASAVSASLSTSHATVTADGGTIMVPVTAWEDTDSYNASVAGSYTFTATLGSLPINTTNTNSLTATVEVVVSPVITNITAFDAFGDISAGTVGAATYANAGEVSAALLTSHATVMADGGTITVPVTAWLDTDSYNATVAGSYTFTATLGSLPVNTTNTGNLTATVKVVVSPVITNITAFDAIGDISAGTAGSTSYANAGEATAALLASHATVTANGGTITVPVTAWIDTDSYNASVAGSYTFTATLGSLPINTTNTDNLTATVEVVVAPVITNITAFDAIGDVAAGTAGSATYANASAVSASLSTSHATVTANGGTITVPVITWVDTDNYNPAVAGSYTFTATLGSLPINTTNTGNLTATVEVVVSPVITNITAFDAIGDVAAGTAGSTSYANAGEATAALLASHATVTANGGTITVPVTAWIDSDSYNASLVGSYTFTATLGSLPDNTTNTGNLTATVEVVVAKPSLPPTGGGGDGGGSTTPTTDNPATSTDGTLTLPAGKRGIVSLKDEVIVSIPANATDRELHLTIVKVLDTKLLLTNKQGLVSPIFEILKNFSENFNKPVTLTFVFDKTKLSSEQRVAVNFFDEVKKEWVEVPGGKINENSITVEVNHFTKFGVFIVGQEPTVPTPGANPTMNLSDITGHWAEANIKRAVSSGIVDGYPEGTFAPDQSVTRAEFAVMLMNALKMQGEGAALTFTDSAKIGTWAQKTVAQAVQSGIIQGYEDGTFRPEVEIMRTEMAVMIAKAMGGQSIPASITTGFADDMIIPAWAKASVAYVKQTGVMQGKGDHQFAPQDHATRAEAVTVLLNMLAQKSK
ncbi:S-layer homology domain-containing protein [Paenibacillus plantarum]|nr:S-layer homology domain-containing protein [Paenibacillus plantarum]